MYTGCGGVETESKCQSPSQTDSEYQRTGVLERDRLHLDILLPQANLYVFLSAIIPRDLSRHFSVSCYLLLLEAVDVSRASVGVMNK